MKIKKLTEAKVLHEEDETLSDVNPQKDSVAEIADAIQGSAEENGAPEISDEDALEVAKEIKDTATEIGAGFTELAPTEEDFNATFGRNRLTNLLDEALDSARASMEAGYKVNSNVLIEGLPGSGKTAIVEAWAKHHKLVLCAINVTDSKLETSINGMPLRDYESDSKNAITMVRSDLFKDTLLNPDNEGKCVLFVDELNRQKDDQIRRPLMSLFNEKRNADGTLDFSKTLLFTICCINPAGLKYRDKGVVELNDAEINRFFHQWFGSKGYDSNKEDAEGYIDSWFAQEMLQLGVNVNKESAYGKRTGVFGPWKKKFTAQELKKLDVTLKIHDIYKHIVSHPDFEFDSRDKLDDIHDNRRQLLSARELTSLVFNSLGDKDRILKILDISANLLDSDTEMLKNILDSYVLDLEALRRSVGLFVDADGNVISEDQYDGLIGNAEVGDDEPAEEPETSETSEDDEEEVEDDDSLFNQSPGTKVQSTPATTSLESKDIVDSW